MKERQMAALKLNMVFDSVLIETVADTVRGKSGLNCHLAVKRIALIARQERCGIGHV